jgi:hypothetical protein
MTLTYRRQPPLAGKLPGQAARLSRPDLALCLCDLGEVEDGFVSVGEPDDHAGVTADGPQVGVEG